MYQEERMQLIMDHLANAGRISIEEICQQFDVSRDTARRDLIKLEEQDLIVRTRGGALLPSPIQEFKNYKDRLVTVSEEKKKIGKLAAALVRKGDRIILDSSTTVQACAEFLHAENCTVITNSINSADLLSEKESVDIRLLGGILHKEHRYVYGASVIETLSHYYVEKAFIGVGGVTTDGLSANDEEGKVKRKMMEQAEMVIVLADHSKFGRNYFYRFADWSLVDVIITDQLPSTSMMDFFEQHQVEVLVPDSSEEQEELS
ncbi:DeoR/GlpR family DNA-binding transcription regulator [Paenibacillus polygoni]|uniref:DeoR/GlpR family DNA-binding transcription regulator n=1 Tax=Paenibacillus polygoni TaxID=3050112 RepID=A0ABY8X6P3_9BACL|nr:DeoR/GlpR family DNA-binding transcription regulator [Paenibacillus polygoni]WIV20146.1 DeoR/GlpR family DNA-binding transcription regulator [Paenibacillus polygoni]